MEKKQVLFLYNGGTIGQVTEIRDNQVVLVPPKEGKVFQEVCQPIIERFNKTMNITFEIVTTKDSTNMTPNDWEKLIFRIKKAQDEEKYDAVGMVNFWNRVLLGCRTMKVSERHFDAMQSPGYADIGEINASGVHLKPNLVRLKKDAADKL